MLKFSILAVTLLNSIGAAAEKKLPVVQFNRDIRPILAENCFQCHGPDSGTREAELRLDKKDGLFAKLDGGGVAVAAKDLKHSELYQRITSADQDERMPPADSGKQLSKEQIDLVRRWIEQGAAWQGHWAFIPPKQVDPPAPRDEKWIRNAADRFILARLEREGFSPSPAADRITLVRRLSFDLTGLPPAPAEVDAFVNDTSGDAYERVVDRLLASKHYGERMAMHWLDLVRYADSGGYHSDNEISISPYRDYVIHAFNDNMPFDQFTREQIAGDLLTNATIQQQVATGYIRLVKTTEEGGAQPGEYLVKMAADRVRTTSGTWLGLTLGCAECHDHKFDPLTTKDFYSFVAVFADVKERGHYRGGRREPEIMVPSREQAKRLEEIDLQLGRLNRSLDETESQLGDVEKKAIRSEIAKLNSEKKSIEQKFTRTMVAAASAEPRQIRILPRGNWLDQTGAVVQPAVPASLPQPNTGKSKLSRIEFAEWLVSRNNPLTARVFVNRLWKLFFGMGISKRLDDIGTQGEWPTHPELLDWLAVEFMESGWDVKRMTKLLVMSNTYQQSSLTTEKLRQVDPQNRLYARQSRWRLDAEIIRDNALAISDLLVRKIGGRSVRPYQPAGYWSHLNFPTRVWTPSSGEDQYRRGLYTHWQRTFVHPMMLAFDAPSREECTAQRPTSNTPKAALTLLNDPTFVEAARVFAARVIQEGGETPTQRIQWAWRMATARTPTPQESALLVRLFQATRDHYAANKEAANELLAVGIAPNPKDIDPVEIASWTAVARALLNLNETITRN
ncbi:MAG: PSD1 domain-containing protein [Planctomycetes bacterium]|nr:PSD1 domain-containing protein [Planctomycetota bacterium]